MQEMWMQFLNEVDKDQDGEISFEEFSDMIKRMYLQEGDGKSFDSV